MLTKNPDSYKINNLLGVVSATQGDYNQAIVYFKMALQINPDFIKARTNIDMANKKIAQKESAAL